MLSKNIFQIGYPRTVPCIVLRYRDPPKKTEKKNKKNVMDITSSLLLLARGDTSFTTVVIISLTPVIKKLTELFFEYLRTEIYLPMWKVAGPKEWNKVTIGRKHSLFVGKGAYYSPRSERCAALNKYIIDNKLCTVLKEVEGDYSILFPEDCHSIPFCQDVVFDIITTEGGENKQTVTDIILRSQTKTVADLEKIIEKILEEYNLEKLEKERNLLHHYIYMGNKGEAKNSFKKTVISDLNRKSTTSPETFDHIFNEHKEKLIAGVDRLNDIGYHRRHGLKRKKGFLFHGEPGCGKTYTVMALANYTKRHIVEIPMSRVKTNAELEDILAVDFAEKKDIIFLFDEIDCDSSATGDRGKVQKVGDDDFENPDKLSLGTILSRLDGIGNYDGALFVATTNCIEKLDKALYRHGRLTPIHFDYSRKEDIQAIIENDFETKLSAKQVEALPDRDSKIAPSALKVYIQQYEKDLEGLLEFLGKIA